MESRRGIFELRSRKASGFPGEQAALLSVQERQGAGGEGESLRLGPLAAPFDLLIDTPRKNLN